MLILHRRPIQTAGRMRSLVPPVQMWLQMLTSLLVVQAVRMAQKWMRQTSTTFQTQTQQAVRCPLQTRSSPVQVWPRQMQRPQTHC